MSVDTDILELYRRIQALEADAPTTYSLSVETDSFLGLMGGPSESPFPSNPTISSNALTPLHMFNPVLAPIGPSFDNVVIESDDTLIGVYQGLYYGIATLYFTTDPIAAQVYFRFDTTGVGASQPQEWLRGFPWGLGPPPGGVVDTASNTLQTFCIFNFATLSGSLPTDVLGVGVEVENGSGLTLQAFTPSGPTQADPGCSNLIIFPIARRYGLA
jgi:hypothetical protein